MIGAQDERMLMDAAQPYKIAFLWIATMNGSFFGASLMFSSVEKFEELLGTPDEPQLLLPFRVPLEFDDWDYIPDNY